jgi:hypothetical protein
MDNQKGKEMNILATKQFDSEVQAINAGRGTPIEQLFDENLPVGTYVYVNTDAEIVAAAIGKRETPADEVEFLGRIAP